MMEIEIKGLAELKKRIDPLVLRDRLKQTMGQVTLALAAYIKSQKLSGQVLNIRTNRLKSSISGTVNTAGDIIFGRVGTNVVYAKIHEHGGTIKAKDAPYLKFKIGDRWISKKEITIPKRPYFEPSIIENKTFIEETFKKSIDLMLSGK